MPVTKPQEKSYHLKSSTRLNHYSAIILNRAPVAQLVEHWAVTREVVSSTPAGPTLRVFK